MKRYIARRMRLLAQWLQYHAAHMDPMPAPKVKLVVSQAEVDRVAAALSKALAHSSKTRMMHG